MSLFNILDINISSNSKFKSMKNNKEILKRVLDIFVGDLNLKIDGISNNLVFEWSFLNKNNLEKKENIKSIKPFSGNSKENIIENIHTLFNEGKSNINSIDNKSIKLDSSGGSGKGNKFKNAKLYVEEHKKSLNSSGNSENNNNETSSTASFKNAISNKNSMPEGSRSSYNESENNNNETSSTASFKNAISNEKNISKESKESLNLDKNENIFYITLKIDNSHVLNIFRGTLVKNNDIISFTDLIWHYNLSTQFMNFVYDETRKQTNPNILFKDIMLIYYKVIEEQLKDFVKLYYDKKESMVYNKQYIYFFYIFVTKKLFKNLININEIENFKNNNFIKYYETEFYNTLFLLADNSDLFTKDFKLEFDLDIYFFFIFFCFDKSYLSFKLKKSKIDNVELLTPTLLKSYIVENNYDFKISNASYHQMGRLHPEKNAGEKIILKKIKENGTNEIEIVNVKNKNKTNNTIEISKGKEIEKILKQKIDDNNFSFLANYFSSVSVIQGFCFDIILIELLKIGITKSGEGEIIETIVDLDEKKIFLTDSVRLIFLNFYYLNKNIFKNLEILPSETNKVLSLDYNMDYKNRNAKITIGIQTKACVIKILRKCIEKGIEPDRTIAIMNQLANIKNPQYLEFFYNIMHDFINSINPPFDENKFNNFIDLISKMKETFTLNNNKINSEECDMLIISYNEGNQKYNFIDCIPILFKVSIKNPSFIVIGTQESGTSLEKKTKEGKETFFGSATHYPHVMGKYLEELGYSILEKESAHKLMPVKNENVRLRVYYNTSKNKKKKIRINRNQLNKNKNGFLSPENILLKKSFYRGAIFFKMVIKNKGRTQKFIFVNTHLYFNENNPNNGNENRKEKFLYLMKRKLFNTENSLVDFYKDNYNIFFFGDLNFKIDKLQQILNNPSLSPNNNTVSLRQQFSIGLKKNTNPQNNILYALKTINNNSVKRDNYKFPKKGSNKEMISLSLTLKK
jgi:hypothetical protein